MDEQPDQEEQEGTQEEPLVIKPQGLPTEAGGMLFAALILTGAACVYFASHKPEAENKACEINNVSMQAQANAAKAQADFNVACMKRDTDLRMEVVKQCVAKGNIPIFINGNVDCKPAPK